jgi:hypothetical protein
MSKLLAVGLMVCGVGLMVQTASADPWGSGYGGCGCSSAAPATAWQAPAQAMNVPPAPAQTASPAPQAGQMAQSNNQTYRSFSADPTPAAAPVYAAPVQNYGGYGYYGTPNYGGSFNGYQSYGYGGGDYRRWDNANNHGNPSY